MRGMTECLVNFDATHQHGILETLQWIEVPSMDLSDLPLTSRVG